MKSPAAPLIVLEKVGKSRSDPHGRETIVLQGIDLAVQRSRVTVIIGPSGGGKTTLVRLVNRLEDPDSGRILLEGRDMVEIDPLLLRRRVALVPQKPFLFSGTVLDNLQRAFHFQGLPAPAGDDPGLLRLMEDVEIPGSWLEREGRSLSLGQQQRVCLARSLATGPDALLLDEPTSSLDRPGVDRLADTLLRLCRQRGLTLLMVTHDLRLAGRTADCLVFLEKGQIREQGAPQKLLGCPESKALQSFLHDPQITASRHEP